MKNNIISLKSLMPKGKIKTKIENGEFHVPAEVENLGKHRHHINIPGKYKLPFCINMSVRVKYYELNQIASQLRIYIDKGSVYFNGGHTSVSDIITGDDVSPCFISYNDIPTEEYVDMSVMFGNEIMWVAVNGQFCFSSDKMPYMRLMHENAALDQIRDGFNISICGGTATRLSIKSFTVTEYENDEPDIPAELSDLPELSGFELFVKGLPLAIQDEMFIMDYFLMNEMKSSMRFRKSLSKRKIGSGQHLTYESSCGFRFEIKEYGAGLTFLTCWVKTPKKPDYTNEIILKLAESSSAFAEKIFNQIVGCSAHSRGCARMVIYEFMGTAKQSCCGRMNIIMDSSGFDDLRRFITAASEVVNAISGNK